MDKPDVVVVGAGPAGVATAIASKDAGLRPLVLDRAEQVAASWRGRYDRLRLNTCRQLSHLPGRRYPRGTALFPSRDDVVDHLEGAASEAGVDLKLGAPVERIDRENGGWVARSAAGDEPARQVVVATGYEGRPFIPDWSGRDGFEGRLLHSSEYKNPEPFAGEDVLVVGSGCTGMEIAYDLAEGGAGKVRLAVRTPPNIVLRQGPGPLPGDVIALTLLRFPQGFADAFTRFGRKMDFGDLSEYGLPVPEEGVFARLERLGVVPAIVDKEVIESIKAGAIEVVGGVESLDGSEVVLADGARLAPDAVVCATGYRRGLEPLVGHLDVLDERGLPRALGPEPAAPGLRFVGFTARPGALGYMGREGRRAAKAIARELG